MNRLFDVVKGVAAVVATLVLLVAVPVVLAVRYGWPLSDIVTVVTDELASDVTIVETVITGVFVVAAWIAWVQVAVAIIAEAAAHITGSVSLRLPVLPGIQQTAAHLVAACTLIVSSMTTTIATAAPIAALDPHPAPVTMIVGDITVDTPGTAAIPAQRAALTGPTYVVEHGDTFWSIADRYLGDGLRWKEILAINDGAVMADGTVITAATQTPQTGWRLALPHDAAPPPATAAASGADHRPDPAPQDQVRVGDTNGRWVVEPGDYFWAIAEEALTGAWGRAPTDPEIHPYWVDLVDLNRDRLRPPPDPDLIFPGQQFQLPEIPTDPQAEPGTLRGSIAGGSESPPDEPELTEPTNSEAEDIARVPPPPETQPDTPPTPSESARGDTSPTESGAATTPLDIYPDTATEADTTPASEALPLPADPTPTATSPSLQPAAADQIDVPLDSTTDNSNPDDEGEDGDEAGAEGGLPAAARVAGLGILAAGVITLITRLRFTQLRLRRPGTIPTPPPASTRPVEATLRAAAAPTITELVDLALRAFAHQIDTEHIDEPDVIGVHIGPDGIKLLLSTPHLRPPAGWGVGDEGRSWVLPIDTDPETLRRLARHTAAPYPALVTVGHRHDTQLLLNLEHPGSLQITGDPDHVADTMATIAIELASSHLADTMQIYCVGFGHDLGHLQRIHPIDDLDEALQWIKPITDTIADSSTDTTPLRSRQQPGADLWEPVVVLDPSPVAPDDAHQLLVAAHTVSPITAVVGYPTGQRWRLHIDDATVHLDPLAITLDRRNLTRDEQDAVAQLTAAGKDLDGIPAPIPPAPLETTARAAADTDPEVAVEADPAHLDDLADPTDLEPVNGDRPDAGEHDEQPRLPGILEPSASRPLEVRVFGNVRIDGLDKPFPRGRCQDIVVYLTLHRDGVEGDTLAEAIWPEAPPLPDRIVKYVSAARATLGKTPDGVRYLPHSRNGLYRVEPELGCDLDRFYQHLRHAGNVNGDRTAAGDHLKAALDLVHGPPFATNHGYNWAHHEGHVSQAIVAVDNAAHQLAEHALHHDDPDTATWAARKGLIVTQACERCYRHLMRAGIAANNPTAVETAFKELIAVTEADEGPDIFDLLDPETIDLYEQHRQLTSPQPLRPKPPTGRH